jgi:glycosyltransferase involved in cell wall biosynthesis
MEKLYKEKKIIQIVPYIDSIYGGIPYVVKSLYEILPNSKILTLRHNGKTFKRGDAGIIQFKITTFFFWLSFDFMKNSVSYIKNSDIVFLHGVYSFPSLWGSLIGLLFRKKVFLFPHGMFDINSIESSGILKKNIRLIYLYTIGMTQVLLSKGVVFNSEKEWKNSLFKKSGIIIPNGVNLERINNYKCRDFLFSKGKISLFFLGRIHKIKGIELIIDAVNSLDQEMKDKIELVVAGTGDKAYMEKIYKKSDDKLVKFIGHIEGDIKYCYLRQCDIYLQPSMTEGLSISMLEAMSCRANIITTTHVGLHEELRRYNAAEIISYDLQSLKQSIVKLIKNDVNYRDNAYNLIVSKYDWSKIRHFYFEKLR